LQTERGDRLVIESLPFEQTLLAENTSFQQGQEGKPGSNPESQLKNLFRDKRVVIGAGAGGTVIVAALAFLFLRSKKKKQAEAQALIQAQLEAAGTSEALKPAALTGTDTDNVLVPASSEGGSEDMGFPNLQLPTKSRRFEELRSHIRDSVSREPQLAADVLRDWLSESR
jgi:flagellar biosynthesis/type III secretory pathway M-ring protein FliF/YscJ